MKIPGSLFRTLLAVSGLLLSSFCFSQSNVKDLKDSTGLHTYLVFRGDTLFIGYDSAYVLNKRTFKLFNENYKRIQKGNPSLKKLLNEYENLIALQDSMLIAKEMYYQQLKSSFDSLSSSANNFITRTDLNINAIDSSLSNATSQLISIKTLLNSSLDKLKQQNKQKFKLAVGGFTIGVIATSIVFLIAK